MRQKDADARSRNAAAHQCLILAAAGREVPQALRVGLRQRAVNVRVVGDAPAVMVALARQPFQAVILIEPQTLPCCDQLIDAIKRYYPGAALWRYRADHDPPLQRFDDETDRRIGNASESLTSARPSVSDKPAKNRPSACLTTDPLSATDRRPGASTEPPLLSDAELAMLLGFDEPEAEQP